LSTGTLVDYSLKFLEGGHGVDTNEVVSVTSEKSGTIGGPGKASANRDLSIFGLFGAKSVDNNLGFQIPNLDTVVSGSTEPVTVGRKDEAIDNLTGIERVETLALVQVPKHGSVVLTTRSGQGAIGRDTDSVEVSSVSDKVVAELAVGKVPDLHKTIPTGRNDERN
jgi:hypothetical protein